MSIRTGALAEEKAGCSAVSDNTPSPNRLPQGEGQEFLLPRQTAGETM
jgi:hypothetical protein